MDYNIVWVRGHVEVYDWAGRFCFSADNEREALEELELTAVKITVKEAVHTPAGWTASFIAMGAGPDNTSGVDEAADTQLPPPAQRRSACRSRSPPSSCPCPQW